MEAATRRPPMKRSSASLRFLIEKTIRGRGVDERRAVRQERKKPFVPALREWLERQLARVSAKSVIAEANLSGRPAHFPF